MTNSEYEAMVRAAFGEAEPGDPQVTEGNEARQYKALKAGLRSLAEVPECQLTSRQLKDAILAGTVKPKRFAWWQPLAVMAGAAAMLVVVLTVNPAKPTGSGPSRQPVASNAPTVDRTNPGLESADPGVAQTVPGPSGTATSRAGSLLDKSKSLLALNDGPVTRNTGGTRRVVTSSKRQPVVPDVSAEIGMAVMGNAMPSTLGLTQAPGSAGVQADSMAPGGKATSPETKIVVVESGTDPVTGAKEATEVNRRDVVFGG